MSDNNNNNNGKKKRKKSKFSEADELESRLAAAKKRAAADRESSLTAGNAKNEIAHRLLVKALQQEFSRVDREQGGFFISGSMKRLSSDLWKKKEVV